MIGHYPPNYRPLMEKLIAMQGAGDKAGMVKAMQPYSDAVKDTIRQELKWYFRIKQTGAKRT